ncbi:MAG: hypothetical protein ACI89L_000959 [Phycisphaerales bacterium]|jgi:hypothetical protein
MDTKWMNGKLVIVPAALVLSLGLIGCKGEAEEPTAADVTEQVDATTEAAPATTDANADAAKQAVDDAADATKEAVDDAVADDDG